MYHTLNFDLSESLHWTEVEIEIYVEEFDGRDQVMWQESFDSITIDFGDRDHTVFASDMSQRTYNFLIDKINEKVCDISISDFKELKEN